MVAPLSVIVSVLQIRKGLAFTLAEMAFEGGHGFGDVSRQSKCHLVQTVMALFQEDVWLGKHIQHVS